MLVLRDLKTRVMIYNSYLNSILQCGIEFWGFASEVLKNFNIPNMILRIMNFLSGNASCKPIYSELKIITMPSLIIVKPLLMAWANYETLFSYNFQHEYNTKLKIIFNILCKIQKTPLYTGRKVLTYCP